MSKHVVLFNKQNLVVLCQSHRAFYDSKFKNPTQCTSLSLLYVLINLYICFGLRKPSSGASKLHHIQSQQYTTQHETNTTQQRRTYLLNSSTTVYKTKNQNNQSCGVTQRSILLQFIISTQNSTNFKYFIQHFIRFLNSDFTVIVITCKTLHNI